MLAKKIAVLLDLLVFLNIAEQRLFTSYCSNWWGGKLGNYQKTFLHIKNC